MHRSVSTPLIYFFSALYFFLHHTAIFSTRDTLEKQTLDKISFCKSAFLDIVLPSSQGGVQLTVMSIILLLFYNNISIPTWTNWALIKEKTFLTTDRCSNYQFKNRDYDLAIFLCLFLISFCQNPLKSKGYLVQSV